MRLFIAIQLNEDIKDELAKIISRLKASSIKGNFTHRDNLHITLVFLGEVEASRLDLIQQTMNEIKSAPFSLSLRDLGSFNRRGGNLYWIGIAPSPLLEKIHQQLEEKLTRVGFTLEKRPFKPHLTIGRQVITRPNFDNNKFISYIPLMEMTISNISLMKSERIDERLTYTEIYAVNL